MSELEHWIEARPAFNKRDDDPKTDYGISDVTMRWYVRGDRGVVQFVHSTGWFLPEIRDGLSDRSLRPSGWDLGFHSPTATGGLSYLNENSEQRNCDLLPSGKCFYDGSGLNAEPVLAALIEGGSDAVWKRLDTYYDETFSDQPLTLAELQPVELEQGEQR